MQSSEGMQALAREGNGYCSTIFHRESSLEAKERRELSFCGVVHSHTFGSEDGVSKNLVI